MAGFQTLLASASPAIRSPTARSSTRLDSTLSSYASTHLFGSCADLEGPLLIVARATAAAPMYLEPIEVGGRSPGATIERHGRVPAAPAHAGDIAPASAGELDKASDVLDEASARNVGLLDEQAARVDRAGSLPRSMRRRGEHRDPEGGALRH